MLVVMLGLVGFAFADEPVPMTLSVDYTLAGAPASFVIDDAPASTVWLLGGMEAVSVTPTRGCTDITMGVLPYRRIRLTTDADGSVEMDGSLPASLEGKTVYLQALAYDASIASCVVSDVVELAL